MTSKQCSVCHKILPLTAFYKRKKTGKVDANCKDCQKAKVYAWRSTPRGFAMAQASRDKYNATEQGKATKRAADLSPSKLAYQKEYAKTDAGKLTTHRANTSQKGRARHKRYKATPQARAKYLAWKRTPAGKTSIHKQKINRRLLLSHIESALTQHEWESIQEKAKYRCFYCKKRDKKLTKDHVIPLVKGGKDIASNIVPACRRCNSVKGAKILFLL
jgi:5-methylcytosine-specific restriction endonuclease McrA